jgi:uncharacterized protein (DUF2062 family)
MTPDEHNHRKDRFIRIRRVKNFLRFMPRRARFHKYPLIGRFAAIARKRSHLWSFKTPQVRPALYTGSILALMPFMGVQLPIALLLSLLLRGNFMILGGLQFLTTPVTAVPIYYGTYQLGKSVMMLSGFGQSIEVSEIPAFDVPSAPPPVDAAAASAGLTDDDTAPPHELRWTPNLGTRINALLLGGLLAGTALGALLDLLWHLGARQAGAHRRKVLARQTASGSTRPPSDPL